MDGYIIDSTETHRLQHTVFETALRGLFVAASANHTLLLLINTYIGFYGCLSTDEEKQIRAKITYCTILIFKFLHIMFYLLHPPFINNEQTAKKKKKYFVY